VVAGGGGAFVVVAALLLLVLTVFDPQRLIDPRGLSRTDWLTHVESLRATILQGLGGLVLLSTLYFTARTLRLNRRGQLTERFGKAVEQLGSEKLAVRLGGIYALEQIALDSAELHWAVVEVLAAFLRENTNTRAKPTSAGEERVATDVQAIVTVLGRRPERRRREEQKRGRRLQLFGVSLPGAEMVDAHLEHAQLTEARLDGAGLLRAHLRGAWLHRTELSGAVLAWADLRDAWLGGSRLDGTDLRHALLHGADLGAVEYPPGTRARRSRYRELPTGARLEDTILRHANLEGADLRGADLRGATDLLRAQVDAAHIDSSTVLPDHLVLPPENADPDRR
jgi:uncharacterized protein YjbI with pentapeptide repeats